MATLATLAIASVANAGSFTLMPRVNNPPSSPTKIAKIFLILNDVVNTGSFQQISLPLLDENDRPMENFEIDSTLLPLGVNTHVVMRYIYSDGTSITSNNLLLNNSSIPSQPTNLQNGTRSDDKNISFNPSLLGYSLNSVSDGFNKITKFIAYISKVGVSDTNAFIVREINLTTNGYNAWYQTTDNELENGSQYEFAVVAVNSRGHSNMSITVILTPADTPSEIITPVAFSLLSDQRRKGHLEEDVRGDIVVYWQKNNDYDHLINVNQEVIQYLLYEQEMQNVTVDDETTLEPFGSPITITLNVPKHLATANSGALFEIPGSPHVNHGELINGKRYNYKYVIPGDSSRLGKIYRYSVVGKNVNGNGPMSETSSNIVPFILPSKQPFDLLHENVTSNLTGTDITTYSGKMSIRVNALSNMNGGKDAFIPNEESDEYNDVEMILTVKPAGVNTPIFSSKKVKLVQKINTIVTGTAPNEVTTYSGTGVYNLSFEDITADGVTPLNSILELGKKYRFELVRISTNPSDSSHAFQSLVEVLERTSFKSPSAGKFIQAYSVNDDLTPTSVIGNIGLRLMFEQLTIKEFNGMNVFNSTTEYTAFENSLTTKVPPIVHDSNFNEVKEFRIPQSTPVGTSAQLYLRGRTFNPELNLFVDHIESSPAVQESTFLAPVAVTDLLVTKPSATSAQVSFTKQINLTGNPSLSVSNRVRLLNEDGSLVTEEIIQHSITGTGPGNNTQSCSFSGLTVGSTYIVMVIAERSYTKDSHNSSVKRFDNSIVRQNAAITSFVASGIPSVLQKVEVLPSDSKFEILWDLPSSFAGLLPSNARAHFYLNEDNTDFPFNALTPLYNVSVADSAGSSSATLSNAFRTKAASNSRDNLMPIRNDIAHYFSANISGTIGGNTLSNTTFTHNLNNTFNGSTLVTSFTTTVNPVVPMEIVSGELIPSRIVFAGVGVPTPTMIVGASDSRLSVVVDKHIGLGVVNDLYIELDSDDGLNSLNNPVDAFDTRTLRSSNTGGLVILEQYWLNSGGYLPSAFGIGAPAASELAAFVSKFNFTRSNVSGTLKYNIEFSNLTNGNTYNITSRFARYEISRPAGQEKDTFGPSTSVLRAPEAPPTVVRMVNFAVASNVINLYWTAPLNNGGALVGGNSALKYRVLLLDSLDTIIKIQDTTSLSTQITLLANNTDYKVQIAAYYTKSDNSEIIGQFVQANTATGNFIRVNQEPIPPALVTINAGSNSISGSIVVATQPASYPLLAINVYVRHKSTPTNSVLVETFDSPVAGTTLQLTAISDFGSSRLGNHTKPINGFNYEVVIESIPNYTYAQPPSSVLRDATPSGTLQVTSIANPLGPAPNKQARVVCNLNGSGSIQNIIVLAKGAGSNSVVVQSLSGTTGLNALPVITLSGILDNTSGVASNQTATFDLSLLAVSGNVSDLLVVVVSQNSSDTGLFPVSGPRFFD